MKKVFMALGCFILLGILAGCYGSRSTSSSTHSASLAQEIVDKANVALKTMSNSGSFEDLNYFIARSKGVLIFPSLIKAGFIFGAEGGSGVLLGKDDTGSWSDPAFYTLGGGSAGLQAGVQETKVVLVFMNNDRLHAAIDSGLTLGGDASIAAGSKGAKSIVSTTTAYKDIYYFVDVGGVFAGVSLEGNVIKVRKSLNEEYYGTGATPWNIVKNKIYKNSGADALKNTLSRIKQ